MRIAAHRAVAVVAAALLAPAAASAQTYPEPDGARARSQPQAEGPAQDLHGVQEGQAATSRTIQKAVNKAKAGDTIRVKQRHLPRGRARSTAARSATCS